MDFMGLEVVDELRNVYRNSPVFPGDTVSHRTAEELVRRGMAERDGEGNFVITEKGIAAWEAYSEAFCQVTLITTDAVDFICQQGSPDPRSWESLCLMAGRYCEPFLSYFKQREQAAKSK